MITAVLTGFYTQLATYSGSYSAYHIVAPQNATLPYVTFGLETNVPIGTFEDLEAIEDLTFWINCFSSTGQKAVSDLADLVLAVMDDATLTVTGYTSMVCRREFIGSYIYDIETGVYQIPLRYRVQVSKD